MQGKSIPEIFQETGVPKTTILRHVTDIELPLHARKLLKEKQGGAKKRAALLRKDMLDAARQLIGNLSERDRLLIPAVFTGAKAPRRIFQ